MPVLKVKKNGVWENIMGGGVSSGSMNGGNADTLDGYHANDFALHENVVSVFDEISVIIDEIHDDLNNCATNTSVSEQINDALANFSSGKTLTEHLSEEMMVLTSLQYGDTLPEPSTPGRIFFKRVIE